MAPTLAFHVLNDIRQGAILSPVLFCAYFDTLLSNLNAGGMGCHTGSSFVIRLLPLTTWLCWHLYRANAMHCVLRIYDEYVAQFYVVFNASKSKCLCCHPTAHQNTQHKLLAYAYRNLFLISDRVPNGPSGSYRNERVHWYGRHACTHVVSLDTNQ